MTQQRELTQAEMDAVKDVWRRFRTELVTHWQTIRPFILAYQRRHPAPAPVRLYRSPRRPYGRARRNR